MEEARWRLWWGIPKSRVVDWGCDQTLCRISPKSKNVFWQPIIYVTTWKNLAFLTHQILRSGQSPLLPPLGRMSRFLKTRLFKSCLKHLYRPMFSKQTNNRLFQINVFAKITTFQTLIVFGSCQEVKAHYAISLSCPRATFRFQPLRHHAHRGWTLARFNRGTPRLLLRNLWENCQTDFWRPILNKSYVPNFMFRKQSES
jgi:hypothetical protein